MIDLLELDDTLRQLTIECVNRGVPASVTSRLSDVRAVIPVIEHARQAQDRSNG